MGNRDHLRRELSDRVQLHRRQFLGLVAAGAGAMLVGGCSDDGSPGDDGAPATTGPAATPDPVDLPGPQGLTSDPFLLGVASGDPLPDSVILWTRLVSDLDDLSGAGGLTTDDVMVRWQVASDQAFDAVVATGIEGAVADLGHSIHVDVTGLTPDSRYWYRFQVGDFTSPIGRTRTMPADDATVDRLVLAFASCQLRTTGHWTAYDHLVADEPDLVFHLGDYVYEYPGGEGDTAIPLTDEPANLADYRVLYAAYQRDPKLQAAQQIAPWVVTWDDHEVENNYAAAVPERDADLPGFAERRRAAYQAFWEHHPVRLDPPAADGSLVVYRQVRVGALATFVVLDGRQYRTDQVCGDEIPTQASACPALGDEDHTMLGAEQEAWLADTLGQVDTVWTVLAQQTVMKALVLGDLVLNVDQWDGYPAARTRLLDAITAAGLENVVVLTGDIHAGGAADIRRPDATTSGEIVAHELVGPGISSPGLGGGLAAALDLEALGLAYANFEDNGYVRCTVTPETWTAEWVVVDTIADPTSPARVDATVEITAGTPGLRRL